MKIGFQLGFVIGVASFIILTSSCNNKGIDLIVKQNKIQSFLDSNEYLKQDVSVHLFRSNSIDEIQIYIRGKGDSNEEIFQRDAMKWISGYLFYKFFGDEKDIMKYNFIVFFEHEKFPDSNESVRIEKSSYQNNIAVLKDNSCLCQEMEYIITQVRPIIYFDFDASLRKVDSELKLKEHFSFFETLNEMTYFKCVGKNPGINNISTLRMILLHDFLVYSKDDSTANHVDKILQISHVGDYEKYNYFKMFDELADSLQLVDSNKVFNYNLEEL